MSDKLEKNDNLNDREAKPSQQLAVPLEWHVPENVKNVYADNFIVQARTRDFVLSFFDTQVPPFAGSDEQNKRFIDSLSSVRAECVGRIVVAVDMVPEIIKALQTTYDKHLAMREKEERDA